MKTNDEKASRAITVQVPVTERDVWDLLVSAFENGSRYWIRDIDIPTPWPEGCPDRARVPLAGGALKVHVYYDDVEPLRDVDRAAVSHGLELMARMYPRQFANILSKTTDRTTGDVFLQLCLFDKVIFG
jgi:hypothetical protein